MNTAVFPGSFDPITTGHVNIISRALPLFDKVIIGIGNNTQKNYMFDLEKRTGWIKETYKSNNKVDVISYTGLTVDFCQKVSANFIIRGLRNAADFEFEQAIAQMNYAMNKNIETVFIASRPEFSAIASSIVREIARLGGDVREFVPSSVKI